MKNPAGTNQELLNEINALKQQIHEMERSATDRMLKEDESHKSHRFLSDLIENSGAIICIKDCAGRYERVNCKWEEVTGLQRENTIGRTDEELFPGPIAEQFRRNDLEVITSESVLEKEEILESEQGKRFFISIKFPLRDDDGVIRGVCGMITEITARKQAEQALRESDKKYQTLFENADEAIFIAQDGNLVFLNPKTEAMTGYSSEQLMSNPFIEFIAPEDKEMVVERHIRRMKGENIPQRYIFRFVHRDGSIKWGDLSTVMISWNGKPATLNFLSDITARKQAEDALRENEQKFRTIFDSFEDIYYQTDLKGNITLVSPSVYRIAGWKPEELLGRPATAVYDLPEERAFLLKILAQQGYVKDYELTLLKHDGSKAIASLAAHLTYDSSGNPTGLAGALRDITERKRVEETLRESEATLLSVFKATPVGLCIMKNRVFQSANNAWYESFGYSEPDIIGNTTRMLYSNEEEYERVGQELYANLLNCGLASVQTRIRRKDGIFRDVILTAAPLQAENPSLGTVVAIEDITDRKQVEQELHESRRRLENIIEFLPDATLVVDQEGKVIAWNRAIETMTGIKKEHMLGKGNYEYSLPFYGERRPILVDYALHPDLDTDAVREQQYSDIQRKGDVISAEAFTPNIPPGDIHVYATASVLHNSKGQIIAAIECIRDTTERKKLADRLNRAEKMEALGTLAGGVAHDLNNILGVLVGFSELLAEKLPPDSSLKRYTDNILQSSIRGAAIIQDLLTLARRGVSVSEVVNLNEIILDYLLTPELEKLKLYHPGVKISTALEDEPLNIKGSPIHLGKTVMNLVSNAAESISVSGEITIKTENRYLDHPIRGYDEMKEGDYVVLTVSDTGTGISANDLGKIFEPFYTKKVMGRSGTGLGLAVVWGTVKDHNGYIDVQSEEGKGTAFHLYFPATREEKEKPQKAIPPDYYMSKGESILIVDDVSEQRDLAISMLGMLGYQVEAVAGGEDALDYLKNKKADLIVLDMIMDPGIDGLETYRRIIEISPGQKAIIVSGFSETDRVRKAQEMGAGNFVRKPYVMEKIGLAVRKELDRKQR
ncbi:MAG: hypothetical protein CVU52_05225 [Deltaproteobacteria bacterium HGW-Deltaproteobacteria-10]|nr:MAG: hypothetical protein CVU52_05225 [Deltaproteobacteria bacterium HGW-Deltaproteobacteria-10]